MGRSVYKRLPSCIRKISKKLKEMKYLSLDEIVILHTRIISKTGGSKGVRSFSLFHSASERPKASFGGKDLYPTIYLKAAALGESLVLNHPFVDGNKRTASACMFYFLRKNNIELKLTQEELIDLALKIESKKLSIKKLAKYLQEKSGIQAILNETRGLWAKD